MKYNKTIPEIRQELFSHIEQVQDEYVKKGWLPNRINFNNGIIRGLLEVFIYGIYQLYAFLDIIMKQAVAKTATDKFLDMHAENIDIIRKKATKARGYITFTKDDKNNQNIKIEKGKIVRTNPDAQGKIYRYIVIEETVLEKDNETVQVLVESEDYGIGANATSGAICVLVTPIAGIKSVVNNKDWLVSEASNKETDEELYARYIFKWSSMAGVTTDAYIASALSVVGVKAVAVNDQHPRGQGTIDIYIEGTAGLPTENLIKEVTKKIASDIIINDDVLVLSPDAQNISIDIEIELLYGNAEDIKQKAENSIRSYFSNITISEDVIADKFITNIINIDGVKKINRKDFQDIIIPNGSIARLESLNVTTIFVDER